MQNELSIEEVVQDTANKVSTQTPHPIPLVVGLVIEQALKNTQKHLEENEYSTYELNYL